METKTIQIIAVTPLGTFVSKPYTLTGDQLDNLYDKVLESMKYLTFNDTGSDRIVLKHDILARSVIKIRVSEQ